MRELSDPLVSTDWLAEHLQEPGVRIVDVRGYVRLADLGSGRQRAEYAGAREEYEAGHLPGAVYVDWTRDIVDLESTVSVQLARPLRFAELMGGLGVGDDTLVVIYDHRGDQFATRLWWALKYYGHDRAAVLDGGWNKWTAEGLPTEQGEPEVAAETFHPRPRPEWRVEASDVLAASESGRPLLLDARDREQYTGELRRGDRPGHVPGAVNVHSAGLRDSQSGTFLPKVELRRLVEEAGVPESGEERPVIAYCNGGVAATVLLFNLHRLGYTRLANYDGSWNEWGESPDLPVERE